MEQQTSPKPRRSDRVQKRFLTIRPFSFHPFPQCLRDTEKEQRLDKYDCPHIPATDPPKSGQLIMSKAPREIKAQKMVCPQRMQRNYVKGNIRIHIEKQKTVNKATAGFRCKQYNVHIKVKEEAYMNFCLMRRQIRKKIHKMNRANDISQENAEARQWLDQKPL